MKTLKWIAVHAAHWLVLYAAFVEQMAGAMYVLKFFAWFMAVMSLVLLTDKATEVATKKPPEASWKHSLSMLQAAVTLVTLVWFGHIATGVAWLWMMLAVSYHRGETAKARERMANTEGKRSTQGTDAGPV